MKRTLVCCIALLVLCCVQGCARQRPTCEVNNLNSISIDNGDITVNGNQLALPATVADLEKVLGKPSRVVDKVGVSNIYVWDDIGVYCYEYKSGKPVEEGQVHELSIALGRSRYDLDFYPKRYFTGSLCVDDIGVTKDSTVAAVNNMREGEKFVDQLDGMYWSVKYGRKSVGLSVNEQQLINEVSVNDGLISVGVEIK